MKKFARRSAVVSALSALAITATCLIPTTANADELSFVIEARRVGLLVPSDQQVKGDPATDENSAVDLAWYVCANLERGFSETQIRSKLNAHFTPDVSRQWMALAIQEVCPQFL